MSTPVVLARGMSGGVYDPGELAAAERVCRVVSLRTSVGRDDVVIARHAAWPFPEELDRDLRAVGARVVNSARAYRWADDPREWAAALGDLTPAVWDDFSRLPPSPNGYILRGAKSAKRWDRMYAPTPIAARALAQELRTDTGLGLGGGDVPIVARPFVHLDTVGRTVDGAPMGLEYRVFVARGHVLAATFYWNEADCTAPIPAPSVIDEAFLREAIARVEDVGAIPFYTLDVARTATGAWTVIEINDGQRAGLQGADADALYGGLATMIREGRL